MLPQKMTHIYVYIQANGRELSSASMVYFVEVGSSKNSDRDLLALIAHAAEHDDYFSVRDKETADFVYRVIETYALGAAQIRRCSARQLVRAFKSVTAVPLSTDALHHFHQTRQFLDANYLFSCKTNSKSRC